MHLRMKIAYRLLVALWAVVLVWQGLEHHRMKELARATVIRRARDITTTLGLVIRSQRRFGNIVAKPRLESALNELVNSDELKGVALLNANGEVVASAGEPVDFGKRGLPASDARWDHNTVTVFNPVDLGGSSTSEGSNAPPTLILPNPEPREGRRDNWPRPPGPWPRRHDATNESEASNPPPPGDLHDHPAPPPATADNSNAVQTSALTSANHPPETNRPPERRPGFRRPPWMTEEDYAALIQKSGLHGLSVVLSTHTFQDACTHDLWLRLVIGGFASISVVGFGFAWRTMVKSSEFQMRLLKASELNTHLREMNIAAAGLAHETRNPLNIIRGLAQMVSKTPAANAEIRQQSVAITEEVDRVTAQLNEYINYSKPREVRRSPIAINSLVTDVVNTLKSDLEDKAIGLEFSPAENLSVNADQQLLRQVVFNLLLNAIQAVPANGQIQIAVTKSGPREACLEIRDNGPGVPPDQRQEIFRPYFTTRPKGTGLGLAVVKQIVLAHGWEIECLPNNNSGATFRISSLELIAPN